jgi:hypothetical protein
VVFLGSFVGWKRRGGRRATRLGERVTKIGFGRRADLARITQLGYSADMANHPNSSHRKPRSRFVNTRWSEAEYEHLVKRASRARARSASQYIRAAALQAPVEIPQYATLRELICSMVEVAELIQNSAPGPERDRALKAAVAALDRIVSR